MHTKFLSQNEKFIPTIANWYHDEWGSTDHVISLDKEVEKLSKYLNENKVPLILTAIENNELVGVAQLKEHEMKIYPDYQYWLGGVYVPKEHRRKGIAKYLIFEAKTIATSLNINVLYLQTEFLNGGIYKELGWKKIEEVNYKEADVAVMKINL